MCPFKEGRSQLSAYKLKKTSPFFTDYSAQYNLYSKRSIPFYFITKQWFMSDYSINKNRIAKNTMLLYCRMLFLMIVSLYTSRVILDALGVEDYGIYNAVAGFITMFSMISASISGAISRFITFVLGEGNQQKMNRVFCTALSTQFAIGIIVVILVESLGIWFLNTHMTIPTRRILASNWVLQFALITFILNLWNTPYNACIIAHERMTAFAYIGIFEGLVYLLIALGIKVSPIDNLIFYSSLMCVAAFIIVIVYTIYCKKNFEECKICWSFDKKKFVEIFGFAGWNFVGTTSGLLRDQGINLLFNVCYGPTVNAARGLATQVQSAVGKFTQNFFMAVQPQIIKSYAAKRIDDSHSLVLQSSRLAFILMLALVTPIIFEADYILGLWLKSVPEYTVSFVRIILFFSLVESFSHPLIHLMLATGNIKKYQIVVGSTYIANFFVAWIVLLLGGTPEMSQLTIILFALVALVFRVLMLRPMTNFPVREFFISTVSRCLAIMLISFTVSYFVTKMMSMGLVRLFLNLCATEFILCALTVMLGLKSYERQFVFQKIRFILRK